jgi:eukaryotic-like serine/threonine-protein kinase
MKIGDILKGKYRITDRVGQGSFGETYLIEDIFKLSKYILKRFKPNISDPHVIIIAKNLFDREGRILDKLGKNHDLIPELIDYFEESNEFYLVQEWIQGNVLSKEIKPGIKWTETQVIELIRGILEPLVFVHDQGVIHRDLKPDNIIRRGHDRQLVLIDFGGVKEISQITLLPSGGRQSGTIIGTPGYMPKEQNDGLPEMSSDIYAVGIIAIEALTGVFSIDDLDYDDNRQEIIWRNHCNISDKLADFINTMVKHRHSERYFNARIALDRLNAIFPISNTSIPTVLIGYSSAIFVVNFQSTQLDPNGYVTSYLQCQTRILRESLSQQIDLSVVEIRGGAFTMGSPPTEAGSQANERPQKQINIPTFWMSETPITQAQYHVIMGHNPSVFQGDPLLPVESITWFDAIKFCRRLSQRTNHRYRLPAEVEWEYACRGGNTTPFSYGLTIHSGVANYNGNFPYGSNPPGRLYGQTTPVKSFPPNLFGLYDVHGNVAEWCIDEWSDRANIYLNATNPTLASISTQNSLRVIRGGSWYSFAKNCRSAYRDKYDANVSNSCNGFRVVLDF